MLRLVLSLLLAHSHVHYHRAPVRYHHSARYHQVHMVQKHQRPTTRVVQKQETPTPTKTAKTEDLFSKSKVK